VSAVWISERRHNNAHPDSRTAPKKCQQGGFLGDEITYKLDAEQNHMKVSNVNFQEGKDKAQTNGKTPP